MITRDEVQLVIWALSHGDDALPRLQALLARMVRDNRWHMTTRERDAFLLGKLEDIDDFLGVP